MIFVCMGFVLLTLAVCFGSKRTCVFVFVFLPSSLPQSVCFPDGMMQGLLLRFATGGTFVKAVSVARCLCLEVCPECWGC